MRGTCVTTDARSAEMTKLVENAYRDDRAIEDCGIMIVLVDHEAFRAIPVAERADKLVYDTRGIWPDQPVRTVAAEPLRRAG